MISIAQFLKHMLTSSRQRQYSYYAIDAIGVLHILVTQEYQQTIIAHNAMQTAIN
jgi:hypothetical protein